MKVIRKINLLFLSFLVLFVCGFFNVKVGAGDVFQHDHASYQVTEVTEEWDMGYGVQYHRELSLLAVTEKGYGSGMASGLGGGGDLVINKQYENQVNVLQVAAGGQAELVPYAMLEGGTWAATSVRKAAAHYEANNPGYRVIAAINGDYFQIGKPYPASTGVTIGQGEFYKASSSHGGHNTIAIKNTDSGKQLFEVTDHTVAPTLTIYDDKGIEIKKVAVQKVNEEPGEGEISLYYATRVEDYIAASNPVTASGFYFVEQPLRAVTSRSGSFYGKGQIARFVEGNQEIINGKFGIKSNNAEINELLKAGVTVRCQYEYTAAELQDVDSYIGFPFVILKDGKFVTNDTTRHPRTIIGQKEDGTIVMVVVDGRQFKSGMYGATSAEMAAIMAYYGCVDAWNLDGGGSSTMVIRKQSGRVVANPYNDSPDNEWYVTNSPSDAAERNDGNCLLIVVPTADFEIEIKEIKDELIVLHVALLTELEKEKELYAMINGKPYQVIDGEVTCDGLLPNTEYEVYIYEKIGEDQYQDLLYRDIITTAKKLPSEIKMNFSVTTRSNKKVIQINYVVDSKEAIQKFEFKIDGKKASAATTLQYITPTLSFFDQITDADLIILVKVSEILPNEEIVFENVEKNYDLGFVMEEAKFSTNELIESIFEVE